MSVAKRLGYGEMRAKRLYLVARQLGLGKSEGLGRAYAAFTDEDDEMLRQGMELLPSESVGA